MSGVVKKNGPEYNRYYFNRDSNKFWSSNNLGTTLPSVSVKEFFKQITNKNMDELKITKEKVLEAAAKCSTAKATLQTLFPEVFEEDKYFDLTKLSKIQFFDNDDCIRAGFTSNSAIQVRTGGTYAFKGFYLTNSCNWEIVKDEVNDTVLILGYGDFSYSFTINVEFVLLSEIRVTAPTKVEYIEGTKLDLTGFKVYEVFNNGTEVDVTEDALLSVGKDEALLPSISEIKVSYKTLEKSLTIKVYSYNEVFGFVELENYVRLVEFKKNFTEVIIPSILNGKPTTAIMENVFKENKEQVKLNAPEDMMSFGRDVDKGKMEDKMRNRDRGR